MTSSSSKKEASSSSKTVSSTETSSTSKTYDDAANTAFASELNTKINDVLKQSGITDSFAVMPNSSVLIDVVVPQNYKYLPNPKIISKNGTQNQKTIIMKHTGLDFT